MPTPRISQQHVTSKNRTASRKNNGDAAPIILRNSAIHGKGCFAAREIRRGEYIVEYTGEVISRSEAIRRDDPAYDKYSPYVLQISRNRFIDARFDDGPARFINHSCDCNCDIERLRGRVFVVAARDIPKGAELTYDYDFNDGGKHPCLCGSTQCRGHL
jgi:uncharacterized protein